MPILQEKTIVIFGAAGGVGKTLIEALSREKAALAISDVDADRLAEVEAIAREAGAEVFAKAADVTDEASVEGFYGEVKRKFGTLDILLNLPGLSIPAKIWEMDVDAYDTTMDVNLKGTFLCSKHFVPLTREERNPLIINIGSMASKRANPGAPMYCTAKAAVAMFSQGLQLQLCEKNIRVSTLNPGPIASSFWGDRSVPREKFMSTDDMVHVIMFILKANPNILFHDIAFESFNFFKK